MDVTRLASVRSGPLASPPAAPPDRQVEQSRKLAGEFVANAFYGTLLKQMNESKIKGKYFHGGRGEEVFKGQLSMEIAKRIGQSPTEPLGNAFFAALQKRLGVSTMDRPAPRDGDAARGAIRETVGQVSEVRA